MEKLVIVTVCMKPGYVYIVPLSCNHLYIYISPGGVFVRGLRSQPNPKGGKSGKRLEPISRKRHLIQSPTYTRSATHTCSHSYDDHTLFYSSFWMAYTDSICARKRTALIDPADWRRYARGGAQMRWRFVNQI